MLLKVAIAFTLILSGLSGSRVDAQAPICQDVALRIEKVSDHGRASVSLRSVVDETTGDKVRVYTMKVFVPHAHVVMIKIPEGPDADAIGHGLYSLLLDVPAKHIQTISEIEFDSADSESGENDFGTVDAWTHHYEGSITIFRSAWKHFQRGDKESAYILRHELGHLVAVASYRTAYANLAYRKAAANDHHSVSTYGDKDITEDFAEAYSEYLRTDGGRTDPALRKRLEHRFAFLDELFAHGT